MILVMHVGAQQWGTQYFRRVEVIMEQNEYLDHRSNQNQNGKSNGNYLDEERDVLLS